MTYCRPMLAAGEKMMAYNFSGYWKDVGTIRKPVGSQTWICSIPNVPLELNDNDWKIYARNQALPPQYIAATANVQNSIISRKAANVYGTVDFSVVSSDVYIAPDAVRARFHYYAPVPALKKAPWCSMPSWQPGRW